MPAYRLNECPEHIDTLQWSLVRGYIFTEHVASCRQDFEVVVVVVVVV